MIEKYFRQGIRFRWTKPGDAYGPQDGAMVASGQAATPLIYDGLDGELVDPSFLVTHVGGLGLTKGQPIPYAWLDYCPGRTASLPYGPYDVLTGYMSGCRLVAWSDRGVRYVSHVGTINDNPAANRKVKRTFAFKMTRDAQGFNPLEFWPASEVAAVQRKFRTLPSPHIFGLITTSKIFYSVLMLRLSANEWCAGGVKQAPPTPHDALKMFMVYED